MRTQDPPRRRVESEHAEAQPLTDRPAFKPFAILLLVPVILIAAALMAVVLLPPFLGAAFGVRHVNAQLDEAGSDFTRIPRFPERSVIYASDGHTVLATLYKDNRQIVRLGQVSDIAKTVLVGEEDNSFYEHGALDWTSVMRAMLLNAAEGEIVQGGSTITQQLVKLAVLKDTDQTFARKFQELAIAVRVEEEYTKDEILELYLNEVYLGNSVYGIGTASQFYFHHPASKLTLREAALLAGMIKAPGFYDPILHPKRTLIRRNDVLNRMKYLGLVPEARVDKVKQRPLGLAHGVSGTYERRLPYFVWWLRGQILDTDNHAYDVLGTTEKQRLRSLNEGGLHITTTLDPTWEEYAQQAANRPFAVTPYTPAGQPSPDVAIVSVDATTGAIRTMLSGRNYQRDELDLADTAHQPGSSFKPFILATALQNGFRPTSTFSSSSPFCDPRWVASDGSHCVQNAEGPGGHGIVDLWTATEDSINVVFARLILELGPEKVPPVAAEMGITTPLGPYPSLATGSVDVTPLEMSSGYQTLANGGVHCRPYAVETIERHGRTLLAHEPECERVLDTETAHTITAMLERVVQGGTAAGAMSGWQPWPIAGKTGTANGNVAVWFVGFSRQVSTAVWVGSPSDPYGMGDVFGGTLAAPIWRAYMQQVQQGMRPIDFPAPPRPKKAEVPKVTDLTRPEAYAVLSEAGFRVGLNLVHSNEEQGQVVSQTPAPGSIAVEGSTVTITVSDGIAPKMPDVIGMTAEAARDRLEAFGLEVRIEEKKTGNSKNWGYVVDQSPEPGTDVRDGATVTIVVARKH